ncbi:ATP-dependent helicase/DNAse subunit B [Hydrogenispora ethanolica]|uniref:ATP-dependent helicase/DNAse subunit B n=1 Tax=Hydrogenispora ethanolica TaxID=1082276 RepID=A0A4R1R9Q0_HYDET|nr:PD-(D/E)XK nuclease family protein [Hydrogenispora ethanolica]TCL62416.1 ATP-dependent helicase/DNAse subunit B [Hydrogenispora ethanolica]
MKVTTLIGELASHEAIIERARQAVARQDFDLVVIFPTLSLLNAVQDEIINQPGVTGFGGVRFLLMEGFVEEISQRFGFNARRPTELEKELLIAGVFQVLDSAGQLDELNRVPFAAGYRAAILAGIAEWKRSGLTPELFMEWSAGRGAKLEQLALLYLTYQELLRQRGLVEDDLILEALEQLRSEAAGPSSRMPLLLYGFTDLTPLQTDMLKALDLWFDCEAMIDPTGVPEFQQVAARHFAMKLKPSPSLPPHGPGARMAPGQAAMDGITHSPGARTAPGEAAKDGITRSPGARTAPGEAAKDGITRSPGARTAPGQAAMDGITRSPVLAELQYSFWRGEPRPLPHPPSDDSVRLLQTAGWSRQARAIAREICHGLEAGLYATDDFLIIAPQPQQFLKAAGPVFREYHLALAGAALTARELPGVSQFLQSLTALAEDWQWPDLAILIRQWHAGKPAAAGDRLVAWLGESYGAISGREQWLKLLNDEELVETARQEELDLERLAAGLRRLAEYPREASLRAYLELTRQWFHSAEAWGGQSFEDDPELLRQQLLNYQAMQTVTGTIDEILGFLPGAATQILTVREYRRFFEEYLLAAEVPEPRSFRPQVRVIPPREARGLRAKVVFITGLEQGSFPRIYINDWKLTPAERRELKTLGVDLETGDQYQIQERMAFYWSLSAAKERLYLVFRDQDDEGQPLNRSLFLETVLEWLPDLEQRAVRLGLAPEIQSSFGQCRSRSEESLRLAQCLHSDVRSLPEEELAFCRMLLDSASYRRLTQAMQRRWNRGADGPPDGVSSFMNDLAAHFGADYCFGITALEDYRNCPYRFFLKHLLRIKPLLQPRLIPENLDLGNLYHEVLRQFWLRYRDERLNEERFESYLQVLEESFAAQFGVWQEKAANRIAGTVLLIQRAQAQRTLRQWLGAELQWAERTGHRFRPRLLEFAFGQAGAACDALLDRLPSGPPGPGGGHGAAAAARPFRLEWEAGDARIAGRIDRVDADSAGHFIVYDYKLGSGPSAGDLLDQRRIQIPVYLLALEQLVFGSDTAVGGSYLGLRNPSRIRGGIWRERRLGLSWRGQGLLADPDWEEWLAQVKNELAATIDAIRSGRFQLTAADCPSYCEYRICCRRQEWEGELTDAASAQ